MNRHDPAFLAVPVAGAHDCVKRVAHDDARRKVGRDFVRGPQDRPSPLSRRPGRRKCRHRSCSASPIPDPIATCDTASEYAFESTRTVRDEAQLIVELSEAAANFRTVLAERTPEARRLLQALLPDRLEFSAFERDGLRGYEFVGTGTYGGLLAGHTCPTSGREPNGIRTRVRVPVHPLNFGMTSVANARSCSSITAFGVPMLMLTFTYSSPG